MTLCDSSLTMLGNSFRCGTAMLLPPFPMWTNVFLPPFEISGKIAKKMRSAKVLEKPSQDSGFLRYTYSTPHLRQS